MSEFTEFPKIARLNRECIVTEKIDGTNAQVWIDDTSTIIKAGSRSRWLTPDADNFGFHKWVTDHAEELLKLGPGRHFGEWWGSGIQRGYGLPKGEKRFSLFNTGRWVPHIHNDPTGITTALSEGQQVAPECCHVVPVLYRGLFNTEHIGTQIERLRTLGSVAAPGFTKPEGIVVFHTAANAGFKVTLEKDEVTKGLVR